MLLQGTGFFYYSGFLGSDWYATAVNDRFKPIYGDQGVTVGCQFNGGNSFARVEGLATPVNDCGSVSTATLYLGGRIVGQRYCSIVNEVISCDISEEAWLHEQLRIYYGSHAVGQTTILSGQYGVAGHSDAIGLAATFRFPSFLSDDEPRNRIAITDDGNMCVRVQDYTTNTVSTPIGSLTNVSGTADGIGNAARFNRPADIIDGFSANTKLIADYMNGSVRLWNLLTDEVSTFVGLTGTAAQVDGNESVARLFQPFGLCIEGGLLYICQTNACIRRFNPSFTTTINGLAPRTVDTWVGTPGVTGTTDGVGNAALFSNTCYNIAFYTDHDGSRAGLITDRTNFTFRKVVRDTAVVTTVIGVAGALGCVNGINNGVRLNGSDGIKTIIDSNGQTTLIYAESAANNIRRIDVCGPLKDKFVVSLLACSTAAGSANGDAWNARATHTLGVCYVSRFGKVFFTSNYGPGGGVDGGGTVDEAIWTP